VRIDWGKCGHTCVQGTSLWFVIQSFDLTACRYVSLCLRSDAVSLYAECDKEGRHLDGEAFSLLHLF